MPDYVNPGIEKDSEEIQDAMYDYIATTFPEFQARSTRLVDILSEAFASEISTLTQLATDVPPAIFRYYGSLFKIFPLEAQPAVGSTTWTLTDAVGHVIEAGTPLRLPIGGGDYIAFETVDDVIVPPTQSATVAGEVQIRALVDGEVGNNLAGPIDPLERLDFVDSIVMVGITAEGTDAEDDDTYLDRLSNRLELLADRPVVPRDFEIFVTYVANIDRALAIDLYNPADDTFDNERMVTLFMLDADGAEASAPDRAAALVLAEAAREVNFVVNEGHPTYFDISVGVTVRAHLGFDPVDLDQRVQEALAEYLHPRMWGQPPGGEQRRWINTPLIRLYEVAEVINRVEGVDYIEPDTLLINGVASDFLMNAVAPLPSEASDVAVVVTLP